MIGAIVTLVISVICLLVVSFAWLTVSQTNKVKGIMAVTNTTMIEINEYVTVVRTLLSDGITSTVTYTYRRFTDDNYYEYDIVTNDWVLDESGNKKVLSIRGLWPGESMDFYIPVVKTDDNIELTYNVNLSGIEGEEFYDSEGVNSYSVLGVCRLNILDENGDEISADIWLDDYSDGLPPRTNIELVSDESWHSTESELVLCFRLTFDTTQIQELNLGNTNALSEKEFNIAALLITASKN